MKIGGFLTKQKNPITNLKSPTSSQTQKQRRKSAKNCLYFELSSKNILSGKSIEFLKDKKCQDCLGNYWVSQQEVDQTVVNCEKTFLKDFLFL